MRNRFRRLITILHFLGHLLQILGIVLLIPLLVVLVCWGRYGDGWKTATAFAASAAISFVLGTLLRNLFVYEELDTTGSMLLCALGWIFASTLGALPFVMALRTGWLDAYFEAVSGFTTTGFTIYLGLDDMPRSILFWRALMQWLGGIGILSFFLTVTFRTTASHHIFGAESHKITSGRPAPGLQHTLHILWGIYASFTAVAALVLALEGLSLFDALCHALTAVSTAGFSTHDAGIDYYRQAGIYNYRLIEYTLIFFMTLGGINFLIHYRVLTADFRALWDNVEIRYWWRLIAAFTLAILIERLFASGSVYSLLAKPSSSGLAQLEQSFRYSLFQVVAILTTTGFATKSIASEFFGAMSKQLFLVMMIIGGCVGSTSGGLKVMRIAILNRLVSRELFKSRVSSRARSELLIDGKAVPDDEVRRVAALFFAWLILLIVGAGITALLSEHNALQCLSGMSSALGNIGPCYIQARSIIVLHPVVKLTYILGMLAGRLEILPVLLLFSKRAWR
jgi:trk system potassium uptake protein TrkH